MNSDREGPTVFHVPRRGDTIATLDGRRLVVGDEIGRGGQGAVLGLESAPDECVKVYFEEREAHQERLRQRFECLRRARATDALVLPRAVLHAPATGYLMQRVRDASPIRHLAVPPRGREVKTWYRETGGLRRRLLLAAQLAKAFQDLHRRGMAYCDLSWDNVLIPNAGPPAVRLIDCDNLSLDGAPPARVWGTDWFMAPEIVDRRGTPGTTSDQHALAVLIYHLLTLTHPLLGDPIRAAEPEVERQAMAGRWLDGSRLPWIDDPEDARNRTRAGISRAAVHSRLLRETFQAVFGDGLFQPARRATEARWLDVLGRALDATVTCGACGQTFYFAEKTCPFCSTARTAAWIMMCQHASERRPVAVEQRRRLFARHLRTQTTDAGESAWALVTADATGLMIEATGTVSFEVLRTGCAVETVAPGGRTRLKSGEAFRATGAPVLVEVTRG